MHRPLYTGNVLIRIIGIHIDRSNLSGSGGDNTCCVKIDKIVEPKSKSSREKHRNILHIIVVVKVRANHIALPYIRGAATYQSLVKHYVGQQ